MINNLAFRCKHNRKFSLFSQCLFYKTLTGVIAEDIVINFGSGRGDLPNPLDIDLGGLDWKVNAPHQYSSWYECLNVI